MLRARIRTSATVCGLLALGTLYLFPATTSATVQVAGRAGALAGTGLRGSGADRLALRQVSAVGSDPGVATLGLSGWQVQSSAATTSWTTGQGATQSGGEISTPGFSTNGWLPVTPDDAGAVGTEVEALLQNGICPDDAGLQPVNQSADSPQSVFYSNNMQATGGGQIPAAMLDLNNDYSTVSNGGEFIDPTYIEPR